VRLVVYPGVDTSQFWQLDDLRSADSLGGVVAGAGERGPRNDERWDTDRGKDIPHIELHRSAERRQRCTRAEAPTHVRDEPVAESLVLGHLRRPLAGEVLEIATFTPACAHSGELLAPILLRRSQG
jgi:hypothetical protein